LSGNMKGMADLLRQGATMLSRSCPECGTPLFQLKSGEIICGNCQRQVVIVPEGEEATAEAGVQLQPLEKVLVEKLVSVEKAMRDEEDVEKLKALSELLDSLLGNLKKLRETRKA
jgi:UPF0148 protein